MMLTVLDLVQCISAIVVVLYLIASFQTALRMAMVHTKYAHIEFNQSRWRTYGRWAPQRLRWLGKLKIVALVAAVLGMAATVISASLG